MKRPRRPCHQPDPLVTAAEAMPKHWRCRERNHHSYGNKFDWRDYRAPRRPRPVRTEATPVPQSFILRVAEGIRHGLRLMLVYEDAQGRITKRRIRPKHWTHPGDRFAAHCELRGEDRDFRVHRFLDCQLDPLPEPETSESRIEEDPGL